jgi:acyl-CoA synthetase (AMP-forming)/AMP-acid ligase II
MSARLDADGYLSIVDRCKSLIISGGYNVYPAEVEQVIRQLPWVAEVVVVGAPDQLWGEELIAHCRAHLLPRADTLVTAVVVTVVRIEPGPASPPDSKV